MVQPLSGNRQVRACSPKPMRQPLINVAPGLQACLLQQVFEEQSLIPPWVPTADCKIRFLRDICMRVKEKWRESFVRRRSAVLFYDLMSVFEEQVVWIGNSPAKKSMDLRVRPGASSISSTLIIRSRYFCGLASGWQKLPAKKTRPVNAGESPSCSAR